MSEPETTETWVIEIREPGRSWRECLTGVTEESARNWIARLAAEPTPLVGEYRLVKVTETREVVG